MMQEMTAIFDSRVCQKSHQKIRKRNVGRFLKALARPYVMHLDKSQAYKQMALDEAREKEATEWSENLIHDDV